MTQTQNTSQQNKSTLPKGWKEVSLGDVAEINSSKRIFAKEYTTSGIPFFRGKEITEKFNGNKISTELFITEEKYLEIKEKYGVPKENDILLTSVGTLGNPYLVEKDLKFYFKDGNLTWFHNYKNINPKFLFYWIISSDGKESLSHAKIGSTQQAYTMSALKKVGIKLPPLPQQKSIAKILSSFDDKIELLREQNETLESIGQEIFKEWFGKYKVGDELPEGWRVGKLGEIAKLKSGYAFKSKDFVEENNKKALKIKDLKGNGKIDLVDISCIDNEVIKLDRVKYFKLNAGDIVLAMSGNTTGKIGIVPESEYEIFLNQRVGKFFLEDKSYNSFLYFFLMSGNYEERILNMGYGSAQPNISPTQIENIDLIFPDRNRLNEFLDISDNLFKKVLKNNSQIQELEKTRDLLLPKLMKGEILVD